MEFTDLKKGLIHDDIHDQNIVVMGEDKLGVIDYGDLNYFYQIQELATVLSDLFYDFRSKHYELLH